MDIRTLVVDDDQDSCDLIEKILKKEGYRVVTMTDGRRVEDELRKSAVHLAIVDLKMPEISGLDVLATIRAHDSDCAVILMTGYATLDSAVAALRGGVVDYLRKPVREDELLGAVRRALAAKGLALLPEEELHRNIGASIRDLRKKRTLTLKQLAKRTGLSVSLLSQIERAESSASVTSLYKIAHALKIRLPELFARV
ncbi:MAG: response regulator [Deltaproteobacteria bacterium]|nr:response regulator [Deltaproteobacteria bacterium]